MDCGPNARHHQLEEPRVLGMNDCHEAPPEKYKHDGLLEDFLLRLLIDHLVHFGAFGVHRHKKMAAAMAKDAENALLDGLNGPWVLEVFGELGDQP